MHCIATVPQQVNDPAVMVAFPITDDLDGASLVAWTTTPWTLPSNLALCVNPEFEYVKVDGQGSNARSLWHWRAEDLGERDAA